MEHFTPTFNSDCKFLECFNKEVKYNSFFLGYSILHLFSKSEVRTMEAFWYRRKVNLKDTSKTDIVGQALSVCGIGACMLVCVWYTELTCIPYWASKTDIVGQVLGPSVGV